MPLFIAALLGGLIQAAGTLVGKVLLSLGIGYAAYTGISASIEWARDQAIAKIQALDPLIVQFASVLQVGTAVSIITSAYLARMVLNGLTGDTIKRMITK